MSEAEQFVDITVEQVADYEFRIRFDDTAIPDLTTDETSPIGRDAGPNPSRLLAAAVANCLTASLLFALRKYKNTPGQLGAKARATLARNEHGRWRIAHIGVDLQLADRAEVLEHLDRVLAQFEDFCIVTQSVRQGIAVDVSVRDGAGQSLSVPNAG
ncbi:OsmC family peroxiredoxin [Dyella solisilvae]|uniref:OsmC family peroxiredoxin n=1 Tax=Dyella solisilvae TaxID=1920168 RepID=A0A370KDG1_9GAMM|nr:OsmC family protein [Dyella solisilvae]RDJ00468.1 OsmC family peroxiredoxin [Dyella solisilvae]